MSEWKSVKDFGIPDDEQTYLVTHFDGKSWVDPWLECSYVCPEYGTVMWLNCDSEEITHFAKIQEFPEL